MDENIPTCYCQANANFGRKCRDVRVTAPAHDDYSEEAKGDSMGSGELPVTYEELNQMMPLSYREHSFESFAEECAWLRQDEAEELARIRAAREAEQMKARRP